MLRIKYMCFFVILSILCSCIKQKDTCPQPLAKPTLAGYNIPISTTQNSDTLSVLSPDPLGKYIWTDPYGVTYTGASIQQYVYYGNWSVIEQKGACTSDTTKFTVSPWFVGCGLGPSTFLLQGNTPLHMTYIPYSNNALSTGYYLIPFRTQYDSILYICFSNVPTTGYHRVVGGSYYGLTSQQCFINYCNQYISSSGLVYVTVNGAAISIQFCNVVFYYNGTAYTASGNVLGS